ncbi:MAG: hypothetical protein GC201_11525 [Alphaproteobacteria bacterium]|nr:hypothetical protein [Alphaproteobacteria bacterium]
MSTAAGASAAPIQNVLFDLNNIPPTITTAAESASVIANNQLDLTTNLTSANTVGTIGSPTSGTQDVEGGTDTVLVGINTIFAETTGNNITNGVDLYTATGDPALNAATVGSLQANLATGTATLDATVSGAEIRAAYEDMGAGSSIRVDQNELTADATVNRADNSVSGDINPLLSSADPGHSTITNPGVTDEAVISATALVANAQLVSDLSSPLATVTGSRIGLAATVDGSPDSLDGMTVAVTDNLARAQFTGNSAANGVYVTDGGAVTLTGTAGVTNIQAASGDDAFSAVVSDTVIELGHTGPFVTIDDLDGTTATFTGNDILGSVTANTAGNTVSLTGVSQQGVAAAGDQVNSFDAGTPDTAEVLADLFVQNAQYSQVGASADVNGDLNSLVEDMTGSTVTADDNSIGASSTGNATVNSIEVGNATSFNSVVGVNSVQYAEGLQTADLGDTTDGANLTVFMASLNADHNIVDSSGSVDGNRFFSEATGNAHDGSISIAATDVTGLDPAASISSDRPATGGGVTADISLLNAQVLDGGGAEATSIARIRTNVAYGGAAGTVIDNSTISNSGNEFSAQAIGNLSTQAGISVDATTVAATVGLVTAQTVEDGASLVAQIDAPTTNQSMIALRASASTVTDSTINVDANTFDAQVFGNLADSTTNAVDVAGTSLGDGGSTLPSATVDRSAPVSATNVQAGYMLVNDQSVEDLEAATVTATSGSAASSAQGDLVQLQADLGPSFVTSGSTFTVDDNTSTVAATLNQATSAVTVASEAGLDASTALVNVQSVADENGNLSSAGFLVRHDDADILLSAGGPSNDPALSIVDSTFSLSGNTLLTSGRVNLADNSVDVSAETQQLTQTHVAGDTTVSLGGSTNAVGETLLVNDQSFSDLTVVDAANSASMAVTNSDTAFILSVGVTADGGLTDSTVNTDGNSMRMQALGNDAANSLALDVGSFDLSQASSAGDSLNGPIATLVSNQSGLDNGDGGSLRPTGDGLEVTADLSWVVGAISGTTISADGNQIRSIGRVNNVTNTLAATGTSVPDAGSTATPEADVLDPVGAGIEFTDSMFALASQQINGVGVDSSLTAASVNVVTQNAPTIDGTDISASGNALVAEARGNDSANGLSLDFTDNNAQAFLASVQQVTEADPTIEAQVDDSEVQLLAYNGSASPTITDSALRADGNAIAALASSNRSTNQLSVAGTNILSSADVPNSVGIDVGGSPGLQSNGDFALINAQGSSDPISPDQDESVLASVTGSKVFADASTFDTGSMTVDNNVVLGQATVHSATNRVSLEASANIGAVGDAPSADLLSQQALADDSLVSSTVDTVAIGGVFEQGLGAAGSVSGSASGNLVAATATGGTVDNALTANAGAALVGAGAGFDYDLHNVQVAIDSDSTDIKSSVADAGLGLTVFNDLSGDSLTVDNNAVQAQTQGFVARNVASFTAGSSSDVGAVVNSLQVLDNMNSLTATNQGSDVGVGVEGSALNGNVSVSGNLVSASTAGNTAVNALTTEAGASLQESSGAGASTALGSLSVTNADYAALNRQEVASVDGGLVSSVENARIGTDGFSGVNGVDSTSVSVLNNQVSAASTGNDAVNSLALNTGTFAHPSGAVANLQTISDTAVSATVNTAGVGIGVNGNVISGTSSNSVFSVRGNSVGASAIGNRAVNSITAD